jgi:ABC-2 type transport system ATP-binding protein
MNVTKQYSNFKLDNVSLTIKSGELVGLIVQNGAGKTTLLDIITGKRVSDSGSVVLFDKQSDRDALKKQKQKIGVVEDGCGFHGCFSPKEIASFLRKIYTDWDDDLYTSLLKELAVNWRQKIDDMSKGTKTKMLLAIALAHHPQVMILDEITSGLDPVIRNDVLMILKKVVSDNEKAILFSSHITSDLEKAANRIVILDEGRIIGDYAIEEVRNMLSSDTEIATLDDFFPVQIGSR